MNKQYSPSQFNHIDVENNLNLLYVTVKPGTTKGFLGTKSEIDNNSVINLGVYDLSTDNLLYVFDQTEEQKIEAILFEVKYSRRDRRIEYNTHHTFHLINNVIPEEIPLSENIFIVREGANPEEKEFWTCTKRGADKKLIKTFRSEEIWKIDVKNRKVLFIKRAPNELLIESCFLG
jgi:hypothetical protein